MAKVAFVNNITAKDEGELELAVGNVGPVSIAYQVAHDFRHYKSGVYDGQCDTSPESVNHAVVAVGYGQTLLGKKYWTGACRAEPCLSTAALLATPPSRTARARVRAACVRMCVHVAVRNSWGTSFGMDGYFKIARGVNKCGLADCASFPTPL